MNCNKNASFISGDCNKKHLLHAHTHTHTHTHIKAWADLDFISGTVAVKRQWLWAFGNINTVENHRANHAIDGVWFGNNAYTRLITHMQICYNAIHNGFWSGFNMKIEPWHDKTIKMICAPSEDSDQPGHPPNLIRVSAVRPKQNWVLSYSLSTQRRLWSDWADA